MYFAIVYNFIKFYSFSFCLFKVHFFLEAIVTFHRQKTPYPFQSKKYCHQTFTKLHNWRLTKNFILSMIKHFNIYYYYFLFGIYLTKYILFILVSCLLVRLKCITLVFFLIFGILLSINYIRYFFRHQ